MMRCQLPLPFVHRPDYAGSAWLTHEGAAEAEAWLAGRDWPGGDWPGGRLALWGETGTGKTHLLHRWAAEARTGLGLPGAWPHAPVVIDEADRVEDATLLHALNAAAEARMPVLLAARLPPGRWRTTLPDLRSRLRAVHAVELLPGDAVFRAMLLERLLSERQITVRPALQRWMLTRLPREAGVLREVVARLDVAALAAGRSMTQALAAETLADLFDDNFAAADLPPSPEPPCLL